MKEIYWNYRKDSMNANSSQLVHMEYNVFWSKPRNTLVIVRTLIHFQRNPSLRRDIIDKMNSKCYYNLNYEDFKKNFFIKFLIKSFIQKTSTC